MPRLPAFKDKKKNKYERSSGSISSFSDDIGIGSHWIHLPEDEGFNGTAETITLNEQFRTRIKPVLSIINELRLRGADGHIRLPTIAVVGDQSTGKSSVLEMISGVQLPRGTGLITRCPIQLEMNSCTEDTWEASVKYQNREGRMIQKTVSKSESLDSAITDAQNDITGNDKGISANIIQVTIRSKESPDLSLIDLPGIARYTKEEGTSVAATTIKLIREHINKPEVIILVVIPCTVDIEAVEAISLAKEADPNCDRTVGVLTFPDRMQGEQDSKEIISILNNEKIPLKLGFVTVRCRSKEELDKKVSLKEALAIEEEFFAQHPYFGSLQKKQRGIKTLSTLLCTELYSAIARDKHSMIQEAKKVIHEYQERIHKLDIKPATTNKDMVKILNKFCQTFKEATRNQKEKYKMTPVFRKHANNFAKEVQNCLLDRDGNLNEKTRQKILAWRGLEFPSFDNLFHVLRTIVLEEFLPQIRIPADEFMDNIANHVSESIYEISADVMENFPMLQVAMCSACENLHMEITERCSADIAKLFKQEKSMFIQDVLYDESLRQVVKAKKKQDKEKAKLENKNPEGGEDVSNSGLDLVENQESKSKYEDIYDGLSHDHDGHRRTAFVLRGTEAYVKVVIRRLMDNIPLSVLHFQYHVMSKELSTNILLRLTETEEIRQLFQENPAKVKEVEDLKANKQRLEGLMNMLQKL